VFEAGLGDCRLSLKVFAWKEKKALCGLFVLEDVSLSPPSFFFDRPPQFNLML